MLVNVFMIGFALSLALLLAWFFLAMVSKVSDRILNVVLFTSIISHFGCWIAAIILS